MMLGLLLLLVMVIVSAVTAPAVGLCCVLLTVSGLALRALRRRGRGDR